MMTRVWRRKHVAIACACLVLIPLLTMPVAAETWGWDAQNSYYGYQNPPGRRCGLENRPGYNYAVSVVEWFPTQYSARFEYSEQYAWEEDLAAYSSSRVEACTFFIWAGHGYGSGWGPHFFTQNSTLVHTGDHGANKQDAAFAEWAEIRWGGVNWATMYTCNFFYPESSQVSMFHMCEGIHFFVGFNQTMYMDRYEGADYGSLISQPDYPYPIKDAFWEAARLYQPSHRPQSEVTRTVTLGHNSTFGDKLLTYAADPPSYVSNPSGYQYYKMAI